MSEFDKLENDAEQEVKDHPQQVHEAEQDAEHAVESKFGFGGDQGRDGQQEQGQDGQGQGGDSGQAGDGGQGTAQGGQGQ
jgi:hypothetical protein